MKRLIPLDYLIFILATTGIIAGLYRYKVDHKLSWLIGIAMLIFYGVNHVFSIRKRLKLERLIETIE